MLTRHNTVIGDSRFMRTVADGSVQLIVTSPPYPMIEMWDSIFAQMEPRIEADLDANPASAFERMHSLLDQVWRESYRVLSAGGFCCINIGDATRSLNGQFQLFTNHARILQKCQQLGFTSLPPIIWRKPTNAPNKFMGSGMLPAGAYVTYEHEYILILRKGSKRDFSSVGQKEMRSASAFFWEERNIWFSDLWQLTGARQQLSKGSRLRSGSYPLELPSRLIQMYSIYGDTVLDPFAGTGTTGLAAALSGRNSISFELDPALSSSFAYESPAELLQQSHVAVSERLRKHMVFVRERLGAGKTLKHTNELYGFPVMTSQETKARFFYVNGIERKDDCYCCQYREIDEADIPGFSLRATA